MWLVRRSAALVAESANTEDTSTAVDNKTSSDVAEKDAAASEEETMET